MEKSYKIKLNKQEDSKPIGFGDTIEGITKATGIKKAVEIAAKAAGVKDCGCGKRKDALNKLFPYNK
jgi:hypothetical protein